LDRQLARLGDHGRPASLDVVPKIDVLEYVEVLELVLPREQLNLARHVAQAQEASLAEAPPRDQATEDDHGLTTLRQLGNTLGIVRLARTGRLEAAAEVEHQAAALPIHAIAERVLPTRPQVFGLVATCANELLFGAVARLLPAFFGHEYSCLVRRGQSVMAPAGPFLSLS